MNTYPRWSSFRQAISGFDSVLSAILSVGSRWLSVSRASLIVAALGLVGSSAHAAITKVFVQGSNTIYQGTGTGLTGFASFPQVMAFDADNGGTIVRQVIAAFKYRNDGDPSQTYLYRKMSLDGGQTYGALLTTPQANIRSGLRRRNGTIITCQYFTAPVGSAPATSWTFDYHTSTNNGTSWSATSTATANFSPYALNNLNIHTGMLEDNDGNLYLPAYCKVNPNARQQNVMLKSTNGGANWTYLSTISYDGGWDSIEVSVARCVDNSWLAVFRNYNGSVTNTLKYCRSTNLGGTWSVEAAIPAGLTAGQGHVDPELRLLPNGVMALAYGVINTGSVDRDVRLVFSPDGNGTTWTNDTMTFDSVDGGPIGDESTGYTSNVALTAHRLLHIADTGTGWNYGIGYGGTIPSPNPFKTWGKIVDVEIGTRNRIDLKGLYAAYPGMITTDLTASNSASPEARVAGAFDGSTDYWSAAFKNATSGSYTIDLQEVRTLNGVGVCLRYNNAQSATVEVATALGGPWTGVKTYTNAIHNAIDYTTFASTPARYLRVTVNGASPVFLNEIELYSTADTFENYVQYAVPTGYTAPNAGFVVTGGAGYGYQSERTLYLSDGDTTNKTITKTTTATTSKTFEFAVKPSAYAPTSGAVQFHIISAGSPVYHLAMFSNGSVNYHTTTWTQIAGAGTVPEDTWSRLRVVATISPATATVYRHNGSTWVSIGTAAKKGAATTMDGFLFGSGGSGAIGDQAFFDDVSFN